MLVTKHWVRFTATTGGQPQILDQEGVTGVFRHAAGVYTISWEDDLDLSYSIQATATATLTSGVFCAESRQLLRGQKQVTIVCFNSFSTGVDPDGVNVEIKVKE